MNFLTVQTRRIPKFLIASLAFIGVLSIGIVIGYSIGINPNSQGAPCCDLQNQNEKLTNLVDLYQELSYLYFYQGQDLDVLLNKDILENHPEEIADALQSMSQHRDMINVQLGRIFELRKAAGLSEYNGLSLNKL